MNERCGQPELSAQALSAERLDADELARWRRHLAACSACRRQASVDDGLRRIFAGVPPPPLRVGFVERFERRRSAGGQYRWLLRGYWIGFAVVSIWVLAGVDWTRFHAWVPALAAAWVAVLIVSPVLALLGPWRVGAVIDVLGSAAGRRGKGVSTV